MMTELMNNDGMKEGKDGNDGTDGKYGKDGKDGNDEKVGNSSRTQLMVEPITGVIVCDACGCGFLSKRSINGHLVKWHTGLNNSERTIMVDEAMAKQERIVKEGNPLRQVYIETSMKVARKASHVNLKPLSYIMVEDGYECPLCFICFKGVKNMVKHGENVHGKEGKEFEESVIRDGCVKVQSL